MRAFALRPKVFVLAAVVLCLFASANGGRIANAQTIEQCAAAWSRARANYAAADVEAFIHNYPTCAQVTEARRFLEEVSSPTLGGHPTRFSPVGRILLRRMPFVAEGGGYGVVLLRPALRRNRQACEVMRRALTFEVAAVDRTPDPIDGFYVYRRPIYWPAKDNSKEIVDWKCEEMLNAYDYERAWLPFNGSPHFSNLGPYIVLVKATGTHAAVFDFSSIPTDEFDAQFDVVLRYMSRDSSIWKEPYYVKANFRQRVKKFLVDDNQNINFVFASLIALPKTAKIGVTSR